MAGLGGIRERGIIQAYEPNKDEMDQPAGSFRATSLSNGEI